MNTPDQTENWLMAWLDGSLTEAQRRAWEEKMAQDPALRQQLEELVHLTRTFDHLPQEQPSGEGEMRFLRMLEQEKQHTAETQGTFKARVVSIFSGRGMEWGAAAAAVLLLIGVGFGWLWQHYQTQQMEMAALREEVKQTQRILLLSMLEKSSASERIQAVNVLKTGEPDRRVTDALLQTLNFDEVVNVRVKAAQALIQLGGENPAVKDALLNSLKAQKSPEVQIALIDALVALEEKRAVSSLQKMSQDKQLMKIVRQRAAVGASTLRYEL
jgi:hypothetical protein